MVELKSVENNPQPLGTLLLIAQWLNWNIGSAGLTVNLSCLLIAQWLNWNESYIELVLIPSTALNRTMVELK